MAAAAAQVAGAAQTNAAKIAAAAAYAAAEAAAQVGRCRFTLGSPQVDPACV